MSPIRTLTPSRASRRTSGLPKKSYDDSRGDVFNDETSDYTTEDLNNGNHIDLDDVYEFSPKSGDFVWVKAQTAEETWYRGLVMKGTKTGPVRQGKQGTFYLVRYRHNIRRYYAPLLGDIKPDTPEIRRMLDGSGISSDIPHN